MRAKRFLDQWSEGKAVLESLERQIAYYNQNIGKISSIDFTAEYTSGSRNNNDSKDVKMLMMKQDCICKRDALWRSLADLEDQIYDGFSKMPNDINKEVLFRYYCAGESQRAIGRSMNYDHKQIQRFLDYAYRSFPMPENPVDLHL